MPIKYNSLRWNSQVHKALSYVLHHNIKNNTLDPITITEVKLSGDHQFANVYFHCTKNIARNTEILNELEPVIKFNLGKELKVHHLPKLKFTYDQGLNQADHIGKILDAIKKAKN